MSVLTLSLIGEPRTTRASRWPTILREVTDRLVAVYGTPSLGNFRDPVREIFYILLSARTTEQLYTRAHAKLFGRYPRIDLLAGAKVSGVRACVKGAGLGQKRAAQIVRTAKQLVADLGARPQRRLRRMTAAEAFQYLIHLPGLGPKSAFCVMMCSLDHDVFPVDVNVQRVFARLGVIRRGIKHYQAQRFAPRFVPAGRSKELHVALVEHGRRICLPARPKCHRCTILDFCRYGQSVMKRLRNDAG